MIDRQLTRSLRLSSWPCWQRATPDEVKWIEWAARNVWQPVIDRWGPLKISSWRYWVDSGCVQPRVGAHEHAGTADVVLSGDMQEVHRWMSQNIRDAEGFPMWGELIYERDHIHYTAPGVGTRGRPELFDEPTEGRYVPVPFEARIFPATGLGVIAAIGILLAIFARRP